MTKWLHTLLVGLVGAAVAHIVILLLTPRVTAHDTWARLSAGIGLNEPTLIGTAGGLTVLDDNDPLFETAACRFDLVDGPLHVASDGAPPFWSVSIYNEQGRNVQSFNDRATPTGSLDFVVLTPAQMTDLRKSVPEDLTQANFVESEALAGVAIVRAFVEDKSWKPSVARFFQNMKCEPISEDEIG